MKLSRRDSAPTPSGPAKPGDQSSFDEVAAVGIQQRQIRHHDRVALHAASSPAIRGRRLGLLGDGVDVVPGLRPRREEVLVVIKDFHVVDDHDGIQFGLRAGEVLHARAGLRRPQPHLQALGQDVRIDLEPDAVEAFDDTSGSELRHPVVVHDIDVIGAGLVQTIILAVLVPAVIVGLVVVDRDAGLLRELLDVVVAERPHGVVLEAADGDRACRCARDARCKQGSGGKRRRCGKPCLDDIAAARRRRHQPTGVVCPVRHRGLPFSMQCWVVISVVRQHS